MYYDLNVRKGTTLRHMIDELLFDVDVDVGCGSVER